MLSVRVAVWCPHPPLAEQQARPFGALGPETVTFIYDGNKGFDDGRCLLQQNLQIDYFEDVVVHYTKQKWVR